MKKMNRFKIAALIFCLSLVGLTALSSAKADEWNNKTVMTFDVPVEVPGVGAQILPAGTYVFKLLDSASDRNIVQILNQAEDHVFTTMRGFIREENGARNLFTLRPELWNLPRSSINPYWRPLSRFPRSSRL